MAVITFLKKSNNGLSLPKVRIVRLGWHFLATRPKTNIIEGFAGLAITSPICH
jgi:hypothetical protein